MSTLYVCLIRLPDMSALYVRCRGTRSEGSPTRPGKGARRTMWRTRMAGPMAKEGVMGRLGRRRPEVAASLPQKKKAATAPAQARRPARADGAATGRAMAGAEGRVKGGGMRARNEGGLRLRTGSTRRLLRARRWAKGLSVYPSIDRSIYLSMA